jgi:hypothetical protein
MKAKQKWNSAHYTRIEISISKDLAESFKLKCAKKHVSVTGAISDLICENLGKPAEKVKKLRSYQPKFDTRRGRRQVIRTIIGLVEEVKAAELEYQEGIPSQLLDTNGEGIDDAVDTLENIVQELDGIEIYPDLPVRRKVKLGAR